MRRFEYITVQISMLSSNTAIYSPTGEKKIVKKVGFERLSKVLTDLGSEGWEVVGQHCIDRSFNSTLFTLKRDITDMPTKPPDVE